MRTVAERLVIAIAQHPGETDRFFTDLLLGASRHPSQVNQEMRLLGQRGQIVRKRRDDGKLGNFAIEPSGRPARPWYLRVLKRLHTFR
jgi:hypothetical protein